MVKSKPFFEQVHAQIDAKAVELIAGKEEESAYLGYDEFRVVTARVRGLFRERLGEVPREVDAACALSEAVLAPTRQETIRLLKTVLTLAGGASGIAMVLSGVGVALGWSAGVVASVTAILGAAGLAGPMGWVVGGAGVAGIATYFMVARNNPALNSEKALEALHAGLRKAEPVLMEEYRSRLQED